MAKELRIDLAANTRDFQRGIQDAEKELDKVADALDDVARDGDDAAEKLERSFRDMAQGASKATRDIRDDTDRNMRGLSDDSKASLRELGDEAKQNAAETFSSFDGSAQSFADGLQGTLGGIVSSLGPAGALAGALGAIAIGLTVGNLELSEEAQQEFRESVSELTGEYIDFGQQGVRSTDAVLSQLQAIAQETDKSKTNLADWKKLSDQIGVPMDQVAGAYLLGGEALDALIDKTNEALQAERTRSAEITGSAGLIDAASSDRITNLEQESALLQQQRDRIEQAQQAQLLYLESGADAYQVKVNQIDAVNTAWDETAGAVDNYLNEETGVFDTGAYIAAMEERQAQLRNYQETLHTSGLTPDAINFLNSQGVDAAASFLTGYQNATPEQRRKLNEIWTESGRQNSGAYSGALTDNMPDSITGPRIEPQVDAAGALTKFQSYFQNRSVNVPTNFVTRDGRQLP